MLQEVDEENIANGNAGTEPNGQLVLQGVHTRLSLLLQGNNLTGQLLQMAAGRREKNLAPGPFKE